ncbi:transglycosylase domain-containing protein [Bacteriovoracaceae bacterium]|nr:transglycosylase domain-containing protein [Bacteriovoracaceae bacterium]
MKNKAFFMLIGVVLTTLSFTLYINIKYPAKKLKKAYCSKDSKGKVTWRGFNHHNYNYLRKTKKFFVKSLLINEDWGFYDHWGIDVRQLFLAISDTIVDGKKLRGASTVEQQLIKNCFFSNERSYFRKIVEFFLSLELNMILNKRQILERYLNTVEFAPKIYSLKKATNYLFSKNPSELDRIESIILVAIFPNPSYYSAQWLKMIEGTEVKPIMSNRIKRVLSMLRLGKVLDENESELLELELMNYEFSLP